MEQVKLQGKKEPPAWMAPAEKAAQEEHVEQVEESEKITAAERSLLQKVIRKGLIENHHDLQVQQKDPNSPLYSVKSFEALNL